MYIMLKSYKTCWLRNSNRPFPPFFSFHKYQDRAPLQPGRVKSEQEMFIVGFLRSQNTKKRKKNTQLRGEL